jgi:hypothetical protein
VSIALAEHTGPWTADYAGALPDAGDHARFEVYEGGVLVVRREHAISGRPAVCTARTASHHRAGEGLRERAGVTPAPRLRVCLTTMIMSSWSGPWPGLS